MLANDYYFPPSLETPLPTPHPVLGTPWSGDPYHSLEIPGLGLCVSYNDFIGLLKTIPLGLLMTTRLISTQPVATWSAT